MNRSISPIQDVRSTWKLWKVLREVQPHILHAVTPKACLLSTMVAKLIGIPAVISSVFGLPQMTKTGLLRRLLDVTTSLACRWSDRVWCDSSSMRDYVIQAGLCSLDKLFVLGSGSVAGVDAVDAFSPQLHGCEVREAIRRVHSIPVDARVIGFVGRIVADKGMHELAYGMAIIA